MKPNYKQLNALNSPRMASTSLGSSATNSNHIRIDLAPSADEVARKMHLNYGNQDLLPEDMLQRWLEVEAQLLAEGNATQVYGIPNQPQIQIPRTIQHERISL